METYNDAITAMNSEDGGNRALLNEDGANREIVAKFAEKTMSDYDTILRIVGEDRTFAQKVRDFFADLAIRFKGTEYEKELLNIRNMYTKALADANVRQRAGGIEYHISENASTDIDKALTAANLPASIRLRDYTPTALVNRGVPDKPMYMKPSHIRENILTEEEARAAGFIITDKTHYHGLGKEVFINAIDGLDNPVAVYRWRDGSYKNFTSNDYIVITAQKDADGNTIIVPFVINSTAAENNTYIDVNEIKSVYGKDNLNTYLQRYTQQHSLSKVKERSRHADARVQFPEIRDKASSDVLYAQNGEKVNTSQKNISDKAPTQLQPEEMGGITENGQVQNSVVTDTAGNTEGALRDLLENEANVPDEQQREVLEFGVPDGSKSRKVVESAVKRFFDNIEIDSALHPIKTKNAFKSILATALGEINETGEVSEDMRAKLTDAYLTHYEVDDFTRDETVETLLDYFRHHPMTARPSEEKRRLMRDSFGYFRFKNGRNINGIDVAMMEATDIFSGGLNSYYETESEFDTAYRFLEILKGYVASKREMQQRPLGIFAKSYGIMEETVSRISEAIDSLEQEIVVAHYHTAEITADDIERGIVEDGGQRYDRTETDSIISGYDGASKHIGRGENGTGGTNQEGARNSDLHNRPTQEKARGRELGKKVFRVASNTYGDTPLFTTAQEKWQYASELGYDAKQYKKYYSAYYNDTDKSGSTTKAEGIQNLINAGMSEDDANTFYKSVILGKGTSSSSGYSSRSGRSSKKSKTVKKDLPAWTGVKVDVPELTTLTGRKLPPRNASGDYTDYTSPKTNAVDRLISARRMETGKGATQRAAASTKKIASTSSVPQAVLDAIAQGGGRETIIRRLMAMGYSREQAEQLLSAA